jgi:ABC-type methionine transport system permease subunit
MKIVLMVLKKDKMVLNDPIVSTGKSTISTKVPLVPQFLILLIFMFSFTQDLVGNFPIFCHF